MLTTLDKVPLGVCASIECIADTELYKQRLSNMGINKGAIIKPVFKSPFSKTVAYKIKGTTIAMRLQNAENINVSITGRDKYV